MDEQSWFDILLKKLYDPIVSMTIVRKTTQYF